MTPTKTARETKLEEKIYDLSRIIEKSAEGWHTFNHDVYLPALKTLLEEARQEMKEKCLKCIPKETISSSEGQDGENGMIQLIRTSISSL